MRLVNLKKYRSEQEKQSINLTDKPQNYSEYLLGLIKPFQGYFDHRAILELLNKSAIINQLRTEIPGLKKLSGIIGSPFYFKFEKSWLLELNVVMENGNMAETIQISLDLKNLQDITDISCIKVDIDWTSFEITELCQQTKEKAEAVLNPSFLSGMSEAEILRKQGEILFDELSELIALENEE